MDDQDEAVDGTPDELIDVAADVPESAAEQLAVEVNSEDERIVREREERENDAAVDREVRRLTRRSFVVGAAAVAAGYGGWRWLMSQPREMGVQRPFRRALEVNERLGSAFFDPDRLSPTFPPSAVTRARVNGHIGLTANADVENWRLRIEGLAGESAVLTLDDIRRLPVREMITELRCIEGWSTIVRWTGARLSDLFERFPPPARNGGPGDLARPGELVRYVAMETPERKYYVGLDMASALHPQTLLAWAINGRPLDWHHGAPLRLAIPVKYGIKSIKRLATIRFTDVRPPDFWGERGYDWYAGH